MRPTDNLVSDSSNLPEGQVGEYDPLTLEISNEELLNHAHNRVKNSKSFWDEKLNLTKVSEENKNYWLNKTLPELDDDQTPYANNRIFTAIEQLIPMVTSRPAQPIVMEDEDDEYGRQKADDAQDFLLAYYEDHKLKKKLRLVARHLLTGQRRAIIKYWFDPNKGKLLENGEMEGEIDCGVILPSRIVFDSNSKDPEDITLISELIPTTNEELLARFPDSKQDLEDAGYSTKESGKYIEYRETWFTYYKGKKRYECLLCHIEDKVVLAKSLNPHFNYETPSENFFVSPKKPYIVFNHLNFGEYVIDETSYVEQAKLLQDIVNKRGRQIVENADTANSGLIFDQNKVDRADVERLRMTPQERLLVDGDVDKAATRLPMNILPNYVIQDKQDARNEIDNIFGTHDPIRGEGSGNRTLGQDVLSQRADISRATPLSESLEEGMVLLYEGLLQMAKVFYTEDRKVKRYQPNGKTRSFKFSGKKITQEQSLRVKSGSMLPDNPTAKAQETIQLLAILDPLSIAEGLGKENPEEFAKRMFLVKADPVRYAQEYLGISAQQQQDREALEHIAQLNEGVPVPPLPEPSQEHLAGHQAYVESPEFAQLPQEIKNLHMAHVQQEVDNAKALVGEDSENSYQEQAPQEQESPQTPQPDQNQGIMQRFAQLIGRSRGGDG